MALPSLLDMRLAPDAIHEPLWYGTVRPVVSDDGRGNYPSHSIFHRLQFAVSLDRKEINRDK